MKTISIIILVTYSIFLFKSQLELQDDKKTDREIVQTGRAYASTLTSSLQTQLVAAIREGGFDHAISFCSEEALEITKEASDNDVSIKRTSLKWRNHENKPDSLEIKAIEEFTSRENRPNFHIQRFTYNGVDKYRYYQPIMVAQACTNCHGERDSLSEEIRTVLDSIYPDDKATGYKEGDFRGVLRIEF